MVTEPKSKQNNANGLTHRYGIRINEFIAINHGEGEKFYVKS